MDNNFSPGDLLDDTAALDAVDIDNLLNDDNFDSFNVNDQELLNLMNHDESPGTNIPKGLRVDSNSSLDKLVSMPMVELDGTTSDAFDESFRQQEIPEPDPLVMNHGHAPNRMMHNQMNTNQMNTNQNQMQRQQYDLHQMQNQMGISSNHAVLNGNLDQLMAPVQNIGPGMFQPQHNTGTNQQPSSTIEDLEREKLKLLSKLNEINKRQNQMNTTVPQGLPQGMPQGMSQAMQQGGAQLSQQQLFLLQQMQNNGPASQQQQVASMMQQMGGMQRQQQPDRNPNLVSAVAGMSVKDTGESPLTSFLRAKGGGGAAVAVKTGGATNVDPFNKGQAPSTLAGAMDRSTVTQAMIKQLNIQDDSNSASKSSGRSGNAQWGADSGRTQAYRYSGILPKHASDGHLLRATGLRASKASVSKDNLLYGLSRTKGRVASQSKEQLHGLVKKGSSSTLNRKLSSSGLNREESFGQIPRKGRSTGVSKYKFGVSGSVGQLGSFGQLSDAQFKQGGDGGFQGNAQW